MNNFVLDQLIQEVLCQCFLFREQYFLSSVSKSLTDLFFVAFSRSKNPQSRVTWSPQSRGMPSGRSRIIRHVKQLFREVCPFSKTSLRYCLNMACGLVCLNVVNPDSCLHEAAALTGKSPAGHSEQTHGTD